MLTPSCSGGTGESQGFQHEDVVRTPSLVNAASFDMTIALLVEFGQEAAIDHLALCHMARGPTFEDAQNTFAEQLKPMRNFP
jgi:hypothetical protein